MSAFCPCFIGAFTSVTVQTQVLRGHRCTNLSYASVPLQRLLPLSMPSSPLSSQGHCPGRDKSSPNFSTQSQRSLFHSAFPELSSTSQALWAYLDPRYCGTYCNAASLTTSCAAGTVSFTNDSRG